MGKKDFGNLGERIASVAGSQPGLRPPALTVVPSVAEAPPVAPAPAVQAAAPKPTPAAKSEPTVQQAFALRRTQRKELQRLAAEADMTVSAFILAALRDKGLTVTEFDLTDRRGGNRR